nr:interleukin-17D isoform X2 [Cavia porcellus]
MTLSGKDLLRPREVPEVPARGLLPVPGLPDRALRRRGLPLPQHPGLHARRGPAPHPGLRGRPLGLHGGLRHGPGGLHVRPRAREGQGQHQLQPRQAGRQAAAGPQQRAGRPLSAHPSCPSQGCCRPAAGGASRGLPLTCLRGPAPSPGEQAPGLGASARTGSSRFACGQK